MKRRKRTKNLKKYAVAFCEQVRSDFPSLPLTSKRPIVCCFPYKCFTNATFGGLEETEDGKCIIDGYYNDKEGIIEIYDIFYEDKEALKKTIRHECLHFLLHQSGLDYKDTDKVFLLFAINYNARPYGLFLMDD